MLGETFPRKSLTEAQVDAYQIALEEFSAMDLHAGCVRVLRTWKFAEMPTPAFIRECIAAELERQRANMPMVALVGPPRLTLEEAWDDWEMVKEMGAAMRRKFAEAARHMDSVMRAPENEAKVVFASPKRLAELESQKKILEEKYGAKK